MFSKTNGVVINKNRCSGFAGILGLVISVAIILIVTSLYLGGMDGGEEESDTNTPTEQSTKPVRPRGSANVLKAARSAELKIRLVEVRQTIAAYEMMEGHKPDSIQELQSGSSYRVGKLPAGYSYRYNVLSGDVIIMQGDKVVCR